MKILITGATGLIGKVVAVKALKEGHKVHFLTTSENKIDALPGCKGFLWNPSEGMIDAECFVGVHAIIHLAGATIAQKWTDKAKQEIIDSRVETTQLLFDHIDRINAGAMSSGLKFPVIMKFISGSAIGGYPSSLDKTYTEDYDGYASGFLGEVVQKWENVADQFESIGVPVSYVRTGIVLSEKGGALEKIIQPIKYGVGAPLGSGKQWQSWIHIDDLARIFLYAVTSDIKGVINGTAPNPVTNAALTKVAAKQLNRPLILPKVPKFALHLLLGDMAAIALQSQKVVPAKLLEKGFSFTYNTVEEALEEIL